MFRRFIYIFCSLALAILLTPNDVAADSIAVSGTYSKISEGSQLDPGTLTAGDRFGAAVISLGDNDFDGIPDLMVGAPGEDSVGDPNFDHGGMHLLRMNANGTVNNHTAINDNSAWGSDLSYGDNFGHSIAPLGDFEYYWGPDVAVGAPGSNGGFVSNSGAVYILPIASFDGQPRFDWWKISNGTTGFTATLDQDDEFGASVACLNDWDGDGVKDIAVGAPGDDDGGMDRGAFYIIYLDSTGSVKSHVKASCAHPYFDYWIANTTADFSNLESGGGFASSIANLGDVDGDGDDDLAIGAPYEKDDSLNIPRGAVWIFFMNPDGTIEAHQKIDQDNVSLGSPYVTFPHYGEFGASVAAAGDLDGDGTPDLIVGSPGDASDRGSAYVLLLWPNGRVKQAQKLAPGDGGMPADFPSGAMRFGSAVSMLTDYNGDGDPELAIGSENDGTGGALYVFDLNVTTSPATATAPSIFGETQLLNTDAEDDLWDEDANQPRAPRLATDGQGLWIAVWERLLKDSPDLDTDILFSRSTDDGETWSAPANLLTDYATDTRNDTMPYILYLGNNTWICWWAVHLYSRSTDDGLTWSPPTPVQTTKTSTNYDWMETDGNGNLMHVFSAKIDNKPNTEKTDVYTVYSSDYGQTWSDPVRVADTPYMDWDMNLAADGSGTWLLTWYDNENGLVVVRSTDAGQSWTARQTISINVNDRNGNIQTDRNGTWLFTWHTNDSSMPRLLCRRSTDNGSTWSSPITVYNGGASFSNFRTDRNGTWVGIFNDIGSSDHEIRYTRSFDGGFTWSANQIINDHYEMDEGKDYQGDVCYSGSGRWISIWKSQEQWIDQKWVHRDADVCFAVSDDMNTFYSNATSGGTWTDGASWTGGIAPASAAAKVVVLSGDTVTLESSTTISELIVQPGGVFVEGPDATITITGDLVLSGTLRTIRNVSAPGMIGFGNTGAKIEIVTVGGLTSLQIDRVDSNSPHATLENLETGRYWDITATGSGFIANLTLPYDSSTIADPLLARWDGTGWSGARSSMTPTEVTLDGITEFSQWTVSSGAVPVTMSAFELE